jgi:hypothetical protein
MHIHDQQGQSAFKPSAGIRLKVPTGAALALLLV